jgi:hypothetical protein
VLHYGIYVLAGLASALIVIFRGSVHLLIPLYAVGVFLAFTMSQTGMVKHWLLMARNRKESLAKHWWSLLMNGLGAFFSGVALVVIAVTKFLHGAWIVCLIIPLLVKYFQRVHLYYQAFHRAVVHLKKEKLPLDTARGMRVILTVGGLTPVVEHAIGVAKRFSTDITAVYVADDPEVGERIRQAWDPSDREGIPLVIIPSPYREIVGPLRDYVHSIHEESPNVMINLMVPCIVTDLAFDEYLHNGIADLISDELRYNEGVIVTQVPFLVDVSTHLSRISSEPSVAMGKVTRRQH